jgi:hypothetical protein
MSHTGTVLSYPMDRGVAEGYDRLTALLGGCWSRAEDEPHDRSELAEPARRRLEGDAS